jgi:hypothetical protein
MVLLAYIRFIAKRLFKIRFTKKMKKPKILITGSSGQSGRAIAKLLSSQYEVIGFDKLDGVFTTIKGDLTDWALVTSIDRVYVIEKAKKILHYNPVFNIHEMMDELDIKAIP